MTLFRIKEIKAPERKLEKKNKNTRYLQLVSNSHLRTCVHHGQFGDEDMCPDLQDSLKTRL